MIYEKFIEKAHAYLKRFCLFFKEKAPKILVSPSMIRREKEACGHIYLLHPDPSEIVQKIKSLI